MRKHLFFETKTQYLKSLDDDSLEKLILPESEFPPRFLLKEKDFFVCGYFVSYDHLIDYSKFLSFCKERLWNKIVDINGDFIVILFDMREKKFFVLTSQTGRFPFYFFVSNERIVFSTSFYEVFRSLDSVKLNLGRSLEFIYRDVSVSDETIVEGIYSLPPATLLEISGDGHFSMKFLFNTRGFLNSDYKRFTNLEEFSQVFLEVLDIVVRERLEKVKKYKISADLSSGFDSTLVCYLLRKNFGKSFLCYSEVADTAVSDTDPEIVLEFARKHNLKVKFVNYESFFPFSSSLDLDLVKRQPSYVQKSQVSEYLNILSRDGNQIHFTGEGGDETYWSNNKALTLGLKFPIQKLYFDLQAIRDLGIERILTEKGIEFLFDRDRFKKKRVYPLPFSDSVITLFQINFPFIWESGVWMISPFVDLRLLQVARGIPDTGIGKAYLKQQIWNKRTDIFTSSQFREKGGTEMQYSRFLVEKKEFVIKVLKNSVLGEKGWVRVNDILKAVREEDKSLYLGDTLIYLENLLEVEYFIQQNGVLLSS